MLDIQRFFGSGLYVAACVAAPTVPPVTGTWYQRTAACEELVPATVWLFHSDSAPPMLLYWFWAISR
jgi:hypothetical protein